MLPFVVNGSALFVTTQMASYDPHANAIAMPSSTSHVYVEIGCSDVRTMDEQVLPRDRRAFLLSFEPLVDKFAVLTARGNRAYGHRTANHAVPVGHHHPRAVVLPLAIAPRGGGFTTFHVHSTAGCSSLLETTASREGWAAWCNRTLEQRTVPTISLADAIALTGSVLPIRLLKMDAQGVDLALIRSASPSELARVQAICLELPRDTAYCRSSAGALYARGGRESCAASLAYMRSRGFVYIGHETPGVGSGKLASPEGCPTNEAIRTCEIQAYFINERGRFPKLSPEEVPVLP